MQQTIHCHEFNNGLVLLAEPMPSLESAAFTIRVPSGCVYEAADRGGLAAITCEMALRGAGERDARRFIDDLDNLGVERGESVGNAHTSISGATLSRNLLPALEIYADLLRRAHLPAEQLEAGRLVVLQELDAVEDEPAQKVMMQLRQRHYGDPWGRSSQGQREALETIGIEEIRTFYARHYQPRGAILGVAGNIDWPALRDRVGELLGDWPSLDLPAVRDRPSELRREHLHHDSNQTQIGIAYESVAYRDPSYFQAWGAVGALSGGMSSRLFSEVREKRGLCYSVYASTHTLHDRGSVICYAGTTAPRAQETLDVMLAELARLAEGIEAWELERLKARLKSSLMMQQESSSSRSSSLVRDWYYLGRVRTLDEIATLVDDLSTDSINAYLAAHPPRDYTVVTLGQQALEVSVGIS